MLIATQLTKFDLMFNSQLCRFSHTSVSIVCISEVIFILQTSQMHFFRGNRKTQIPAKPILPPPQEPHSTPALGPSGLKLSPPNPNFAHGRWGICRTNQNTAATALINNISKIYCTGVNKTHVREITNIMSINRSCAPTIKGCSGVAKIWSMEGDETKGK